jgi:membrane protein YqaA with SNARE-associated domain
MMNGEWPWWAIAIVVLAAIIGGAVKTYFLNRNERQWNETVASSTPGNARALRRFRAAVIVFIGLILVGGAIVAIVSR